jgi:hypothetical protein
MGTPMTFENSVSEELAGSLAAVVVTRSVRGQIRKKPVLPSGMVFPLVIFSLTSKVSRLSSLRSFAVSWAVDVLIWLYDI